MVVRPNIVGHLGYPLLLTSSVCSSTANSSIWMSSPSSTRTTDASIKKARTSRIVSAHPEKAAVSGALKAKRPGGITARDGGLPRGGRGCPLRGSYARDRSHKRVPSEQGRVLAVVGAVCAPSFFAPELASLPPPSFIIASISSCRSSFGSKKRLAMR